MRRAGAFADRHQRADRGIVAAGSRHAHDLRVVDLGDDMVLRHAGAHLFDAAVHGVGADRACLAHQSQLGVGFHQPRPVHEIMVVGEARVREAGHQVGMAAGRVIVSVHLDADARVFPAALPDQVGELVIGMLDRLLHQPLGERNDVALGQAGRHARALGVLRPAEPDRPVLFQMNQHALRNVEGPAVIAGQPAHVRRILADDQVEAGLFHARLHAGEAPRIFRFREFSGTAQTLSPQSTRQNAAHDRTRDILPNCAQLNGDVPQIRARPPEFSAIITARLAVCPDELYTS